MKFTKFIFCQLIKNIMKKINPIRQHLEEVDEKYFEHFSFAFTNALKLLRSGLALIIHSILPCFFITTASRSVRIMNEKFQERAQQTKIRKAKID